MGTNSAEWIACFWAIQLRGAIAVPMDAGASLEFARRTGREAGVKLILRDRELPELEGGIPSLILSDLREVSDTNPPPKVSPSISATTRKEARFQKFFTLRGQRRSREASF